MTRSIFQDHDLPESAVFKLKLCPADVKVPDGAHAVDRNGFDSHLDHVFDAQVSGYL